MSMTFTIKSDNVEHTKHYRTPHLSVVPMTSPAGWPMAEYAYVEYESAPEAAKPAFWQERHEHLFEDLDRFGHGHCVGCGAKAWSPFWVADGLYGEDTQTWVVNYEAVVKASVVPATPVAEAPVVPVEVILAVTMPDEPANAWPLKPGRARAGIKVPTMSEVR